MNNMTCKICGNSTENKVYKVREMMFGLRAKFIYFQCSKCECLQIAEFPDDMSKYYPSDYYSFHSPEQQEPKNLMKKFLRNCRNKYAILNKSLLGKIVYSYMPDEFLNLIAQSGINEDSAILDVGCGSGILLNRLKKVGFNNLLGIDPFIRENIRYDNGLTIEKKSIHEVNGVWDLIMFHHSYEHVPDALETLESVSKLLKKNGVCLIRIPTVSSYAWEHYKENWVQLDAPRHFFLHSVKSIKYLAEKVDLILENVIYDSNDFQFWGSEQYVKDIPLNDPNSQRVDPAKSMFSNEQIVKYKELANELNLKNLGDAAAFFLRKD